MPEVSTVQMCVECRDALLGFEVAMVNPIGDAKKCQLCGKKKPVSVYRVVSKKGVKNA